MKYIKYIAMASVLLALGACSGLDGFDPKTNVRLVTTSVYPELPDVEPVEPVNLLPWEADVPRDTSVLSVKNLTKCRAVGTHEDPDREGVILPNERQSDSWWAECGEHPVLPGSNIFIGFDQQNWNIINENFAKLRETIFRYQKRLEEVNRQRESWRKKADEERRKLNEDGKVEEVITEENDNQE